jgi:uncharacterized protein YbaP (TraB family)
MNFAKSPWMLLTVMALLGFENPAHAQQALKTQTKHSLWKVQGASNSVYLFGSIHFLKKDFYPLPKPIEDAYKQADITVFEVDLEEMKSPEAQLKMVKEGKYPEGETIKQHLPKETYEKLHAHVAETMGVGSAFDSLKPWMVAVALLGIELQKLGFDPEHGVDQYFADRARKDKKQVVALETVDLQLALFTGLSKDEEDAMLKETLQEISNFKTIFTDVIEAWKNGDTKGLDKFIVESMREHPKIHKKLLIDRNKEWAGKLEKLLAGPKDVFVVVGAAHLVGKDSVVDLLAKKRFKVQQL